ncbi:tyrosine- kinase SYK [Brachionus plicatilis]|uniref:non-specific protein-tyrosine kinase n=1 Tax=Brachionus plicatilis TaxID=10195 RepID=A0A3M7QR52_BRAPC|nr:tyrosine- kinase SYK [Brachionus plicatilis]
MTNAYTSPSDVAYFYGRINREEANKILDERGSPNGLYLLREQLFEAGSYTLSICFEARVNHYKIERQEDGTVKIDKGRKFVGPVELVEYHKLELDGLITRPSIACNRPANILPINYLFIIDAEFYNLVEDEIGRQMTKYKQAHRLQLTDSQFKVEVNNARKRYRYKYERIVLKTLHLSQKWFHAELDRRAANSLLHKSGLEDGKFLVRSTRSKVEPSRHEFKISLCYNNEIKHYQIKSTEWDKYCIEGGPEFDSITQLVDYYHRCSDGLAVALSSPLIPQIRLSPSLGKNSHINSTNNVYNSFRNYEMVVETRHHHAANSNAAAYVDDEPHNPNNVTNLDNVPEEKRNFFKDEENYDYDFLPTNTIDIKDLVFYDKLGSGCFGSVFRGALKSRHAETPVAIKQLNYETEESKDEIGKEADLMRSLNNPFVVKFIGMCFHKNGSLMIVLELAKLGPLHKYLRAHKDMSIVKIVRLCYQVACAMQYLSCKNLVHRDLAARNVLLVSEELAKVSDFGMSRRMNENKYYETHSQGKWPLKWYPPDAIHTGKFDEKSDVWSFGVTCWEATSYGGRPYQGVDIGCLLVKLENGDRLPKPPQCPFELYNLMLKCWQQAKTHRPAFSQVVTEMRAIVKDLYNLDLDY